MLSLAGSRLERGMALLASLLFLLLLTMIGLTSMQSATLQEKMTGSLVLHHRAFQAAETALRLGESQVREGALCWPVCAMPAQCAPPADAPLVVAGGLNEVSGVRWIATAGGYYAVQNLGVVEGVVGLPEGIPATLYRVTAIGLSGQARSVLESIYAKY